MFQAFKCPSCGASLDHPGDNEPVVRCLYCDSTVLVPEGVDARAYERQPPQGKARTTRADSPLGVELNGLTGTIADLKVIRQWVREGQETEAAQLFQETFGASAEEAEEAIQRLGSGRSVVISSGVIRTSATPIVIGRQSRVVSDQPAAEAVSEQLGCRPRSRQTGKRVSSWQVRLILLIVLVIVVCIVLGIGIVGYSLW